MTCPDSTKLATSTSTELLTQATAESQTVQDESLRKLKREEILQFPAAQRLRWFYLMQCKHLELERVTKDLLELLEPNNEVNIISIIGVTGIGKTTLANNLRTALARRFFVSSPSEAPVLYVCAPANGEKSLSWTTLYTRILRASNEPLIEFKRAPIVKDGHMKLTQGSRVSLAALRESLESMLFHRAVRVLVIDEALHLLRFSDYSAVMDTLKSLSDIHGTKLLLIGSYDIADLVQDYGQVARRGEIIHYRRYKEDRPHDVKEFSRVTEKMQSLWPCEEVPNLFAISPQLMKTSLGSIGLLKGTCLKLASLQIASKHERFDGRMLAKAVKSQKALKKIEQEVLEGEEALAGATYGESLFSDMSELNVAMSRMGQLQVTFPKATPTGDSPVNA